mmetsp:Transcript_5509/g.12448  ORF Transcript_5509/g.12448 Transcript_5509/m.12448 type:complete len:539 (+) Transcript_5509:287-1903(+)
MTVAPTNKPSTAYGTISLTSSSSSGQMATYTAGEDEGRLANAAKEFGLKRARPPKSQIRHERADSLSKLNMSTLMLIATETAHLKMRAEGILYSRRLSTKSVALDSDEETLPVLVEEFEEEGTQERGDSSGTGSLSAAVLGIIKGMVGPAILYLPHAMANSGWLVSLPLLFFSTTLFLWSSHCLLEAWKLESSKLNQGKSGNKRVALSYPELSFLAFGQMGESVVRIGICAMQSGVCLTYLIFVPQNLHTATRLLFNLDVSTGVFLVMMVLVQIPLSWIRDISKLTVTNLLANVLILYGLMTCLGFASLSLRARDLNLFEGVTTLPAVADGWALFFGTAVLLFEGSITLLVPLQEAVSSASDRERFPSIYRQVITITIMFYCVFGITCWIGFGNDVRTVMTTSLPPSTVATTVQIAYSLAVLFTFPLQNFPSVEILNASFQELFDSKSGSASRRKVLTSIVLCVLAMVAYLAMNDLDKVVSLMGSLLGIPLAFVLPPLIQIKLDKNLASWRKKANRTVSSLGVLAMLISTTTTVQEWS